jgi:hypothetical protein
MFDESFQLSKTYFRALQTLRLGSNMVDDALQDWTSLRHEWEAVVDSSGMFNEDDLEAAAKNWDTATELVEARIHRVQGRIARKIEDIKSLRDGVRPPPTETKVIYPMLTLLPYPSYSTPPPFAKLPRA